MNEFEKIYLPENWGKLGYKKVYAIGNNFLGVIAPNGDFLIPGDDWETYFIKGNNHYVAN